VVDRALGALYLGKRRHFDLLEVIQLAPSGLTTADNSGQGNSALQPVAANAHLQSQNDPQFANSSTFWRTQTG
jgi:hypothetical protein